MDLERVVRAEPQTQYWIDIPTPFGRLALDVDAPVETILAAPAMTAADRAAALAAVQAIEAAAPVGNAGGAIAALRDVLRQWPLAPEPYAAIYRLADESGDSATAERALKHLIALQPTLAHLAELGQFLGRHGRYSDAAVVGAYLWAQRDTLDTATVRRAVQDYLITLGRLDRAATMQTVAGEAIALLGGESRLVYQYLLAGILLDQQDDVRDRLRAILPQLALTDPLRPRFLQMAQSLGVKT